MPRKPALVAPADEQLVLVDPADPSLAVPDFSEPPAPEPEPEPKAPPPVWWLRTNVPGAVLHQANPRRPGRTYCNLQLWPERFHPASDAEQRRARKCPACAPPKPRKR